MRRTKEAVLFCAVLALVAGPARAGQRLGIAMPATTLGQAITLLGSRANVSIGLSDPGLAAQPTPALPPGLTLTAALRRLVRGGPACVAKVDDTAYRLYRCRVPRAPPAATAPAPGNDQPIIVTASKRAQALDDFPGAASLVGLRDLTGADGARGSGAIVARLPILASTNLGPGRNKLFIRGVADSSFNGPTQATVGEYLGDVRLNYNAPDPDLNLYDVDHAEVLEGPQGTLYGIGSLGGIIRIVPRPVSLTDSEASAAFGLSNTAHGAAGGDLAAMVNLPVVDGTLGVRAVGYRSIEGGYIEDVGRGLKDVNRNRLAGGRLTVRADLGDRWTVEIGSIVQDIGSRDGQYAERNFGALARSSAAAQPFDNDYGVLSLTLRKKWDGLEFVSVTSAARHDVHQTYDFTPAGGMVALFEQHNHIWLASNENRLSHASADGHGWLLGTSVVLDDERLTRTLGAPVAPVQIAGVRNVIADGAVFGEASRPIADLLVLTAGGRLSFTHLGGEGLDESPGTRKDEPSRRVVRFLPSLAVAWRPGDSGLTVFGRLAQGFRPGGLAVSGTSPDPDVQRFRGDIISTVELGMRAGSTEPGHIRGSATISYATWRHIQADLVQTNGLPYTTNIGTGRVLAFDAHLSWAATSGLSIETGIFLNDSDLIRPAPGFVGAEASQLPNIPKFGGRGALAYRVPLSAHWTLNADLVARYVGRSRLGVGPVLNIRQGSYLDAGASLRLGSERFGIVLSATNLLDTKANSFALGNPFTVAARMQTTPLRPRTLRLGLETHF
jgi:outer membrane receptor protein involved in Fe transport